jgi:hypothetical protein
MHLRQIFAADPGRGTRLTAGVRWENDPAADKYVPNAFGSENSAVVTRGGRDP